MWGAGGEGEAGRGCSLGVCTHAECCGVLGGRGAFVENVCVVKFCPESEAERVETGPRAAPGRAESSAVSPQGHLLLPDSGKGRGWRGARA